MTSQDRQNHAKYEALPEHIRERIDAAYTAVVENLCTVRNWKPNRADPSEALVAAIAAFFITSNTLGLEQR